MLIVIALISVLSFLSKEPGALTRAWLRLLYQGFGWGAFAIPIAIGAIGVWLIWRHFGDQLPPVDPIRIAGIGVLFVALLTFTHATVSAIGPIGEVWVNPALGDPNAPGYTPNRIWEEARACPVRPQELIQQGWIKQFNVRLGAYDIARCGHGGGYIGAFIQTTLLSLIGGIGVFVVALAVMFAGGLMATRKTIKDVIELAASGFEKLRERRAGADATAFKRTEKGAMVPLAEGEEMAAAQPASRAAAPGRPGGQPEQGKPAPGTLPGRPSIVTGRGPGGAPGEAEPAAVGAAALAAGASQPGRPPAGAPSASRPGAPPARPGGPPSPSAEEEAAPRQVPLPRPPAAPGPASSRPPGLAAKPASPAEDEDDGDEGARERPSAGLAGQPPLARPGIAAPGGALPSRPGADLDEDEDDKDLEEDEPEDDEPGPGGVPARPPLPRPSGAQRPGVPASGLAAPRPSGPPPFGAPRPAPKPSSPATRPEADNRRDDVVFDDIRSDADELRDAIDLDEDDPSTESARASPPPASRAEDSGADGKQANKPEAIASPPAPSSSNPDGEAKKEDNTQADDGQDNGRTATLPNPAPVALTAAPAPPATRPARPQPAQADARATAAEGSRPSKPPKLESASSKKAAKLAWSLPPLDEMLDSSLKKSVSDEELRQRAETIEQTLSSFGAPGRVVEVNYGPVITQFGVEPDYIDGRAGKRIKVKVGKIGSLADDLALALAAPTIRIEAPVPGKGYVGIEVPNAEPSIVALRDVVDTPEFRNLKSPLKLALGQDVSGQPIVADLTSMPHLLVAGTTGSGKSVCVNGIIATMLMTCTPDELKMIMVDPKRVELTNYNGIPHLMAPVVTELERIVGVLKWVQREMDDRYRSFAMAGARNITDYNNRLEKGQAEGERLPYIIVIVDELADLMMLAPDETERVLTRLAQMARATGIHIIISTQRPSVDVVTGLIKANFPSRIAFAVATGVDSRVILDMPGAEKLLGRGDMLFQAPDAPMPVRMQGVYVSDSEIQRITDQWRKQAEKMPAPRAAGAPGTASAGGSASIPASQKPFFASDDADDDDADDMFDEAVELVRGMEKASISLLQRHLRIGYTRAARLIDLMEERGVIGPHEGGSKPRTVLGPDGEPLGDDSDEEDWDDGP